MQEHEVTAVLPLRKGSERLPNKNTRKFLEFERGLFEIKIKQLLKCKKFDSILVTTNDFIVLDYCDRIKDDRLRTDIRPENLCASDTRTEDLIKYVGLLCSSKHIMWAHATSPLINSTDYDIIISTYNLALKLGHDSLLTAVKFQNFLMNKDGKVMNNQNTGVVETSWPRTQDLLPMFEPTHAVFMASRELHNRGRRIGDKPYLLITDKLRFVDVDTADDFRVAEVLYHDLYKNSIA